MEPTDLLAVDIVRGNKVQSSASVSLMPIRMTRLSYVSLLAPKHPTGEKKIWTTLNMSNTR